MADYDIGAAFAAIEDELISSMIRNLKRHRAEETKEGYNWSQWQAEQLKALEEYRRRNQKIFPNQFNEINQHIRRALQDSYNDGGTKQERQILQAIKRGFKGKGTNKPAFSGAVETSGEFFKTNDRKLDSLVKAITSDMQRAETAVLRMTNDKYRKIIFNAQVYANTGAGTYEKSVDMATKDFLSAGINCIEYKNGRRVNVKSYAEMALRTANKRAYLQGEGEMRKQWGIHTVILNKRGNPCPLCAPFVGKVIVDDVWSGGTAEEAKKKGYLLMSECIKQGLYHPNCKDSHTTYFGDILDTEDEEESEEQTLKPVTEEEQQLNEQLYDAEQKQQYAERQAERMDRMSKYSLDEGNKRAYGSRAEVWRDKANEMQSDIQRYKNSIANQGKSGIINEAKAIDLFNYDESKIDIEKSPENILSDLETSSIGKDVLSGLEELPQRPYIDYETVRYDGLKGEEQNGKIIIYANSCKDLKTITCALIHEYTHRKYGIGRSQWAECVCVAKEIMHRRRRDYLLESERRMIIKAVKSVYPEFNWRKGGYIYGRKRSR